VDKSVRINPYKGLPGFWNHFNAIIYNFTGPAQVGIGVGRTEAAYSPPENPVCPLCGKPMAEHRIDRGTATVPTRVHCPV
jgi:hypothetical protein